MELAAVFVLSLLGGYAFAWRWRLTRYAIRRHDGQHVYLRSAWFGAMLFIGSYAIRSAFAAWMPGYLAVEEQLAKPIATLFRNPPGDTTQVIVAALYSFVLGPSLGLALNRFTKERFALKRTAGSLELLLHDAMVSATPVLISLENGKCYVGMMLATGNPEHVPVTITILPMISGQRDSQGSLNFTTDYRNIYFALTDDATRKSLGVDADWSRQFELAGFPLIGPTRFPAMGTT